MGIFCNDGNGILVGNNDWCGGSGGFYYVGCSLKLVFIFGLFILKLLN